MVLIPICANSQSWQPFYPEETAFYITEGDYQAARHDVGIGIPSGSILGFDLIDSTNIESGVYYRNTSIVNSGYTGECHDLVEWSGKLVNTGQRWISVTQSGDTIYWPNSQQDTSLLARITEDSAIVVIYGGQSLSSEAIRDDSVRVYTTLLLVNDSALLDDTLSGHTISVGKELGLIRSFLPFCFPNQLVFIDQIAQGRSGVLKGFGMSGVYNYQVGTELHYKTTHEHGLAGGNVPFERIIEREAFEVLTAEVDPISDVVSYSLEREYAIKELTYVPESTGGYLVESADTFYTDTVVWDNTNLEDFFLDEMPRELVTTLGPPSDYVAISFERYPTGNHALSKTTNHYFFDTCGVSHIPYVDGDSKTTVLLEPFGLRSEYSVEFQNSEYHSISKDLEYYQSFQTIYGSPLPALGLKSAPETNVSVYPNPTQNWLRITSDKPIGGIKLWNLKGQLVYDDVSEIQSSYQLNMSGLTNGVYLLELVTKAERSQHKIVKY
ncbi:MAG: hypothetical protein Salg2KO_09480 [Salibacteraceae bacterium]